MNALKIIFGAFIALAPMLGTGQEAMQEMQLGSNNYNSFTDRTPNISNLLLEKTSQQGQQHPEFGILPSQAPVGNCIELIDDRSEFGRKFLRIKSDGSEEVLSQTGYAPLNYLDNGIWRSVDDRLIKNSNSNIYEAVSQIAPTKIDVDAGLVEIKILDEVVTMNKNLELIHVDGNGVEVLIASANWSNYSAGENGVYVTDIFPNVDMEIKAGRGTLKTNYILKSNLGLADGNLVIRDDVQFTNDLHFGELQNNNDVHAGGLTMIDNSNTMYFELGEAYGYDINANKDFVGFFDYKLSNGDLDILVPSTWLNNPNLQYPLIIDPTFTANTTLAQAAIAGSGYNAACFTGGCNYNLNATVPANVQVTDVQWSFNYQAIGACWLSDGAVRFNVNGCVSPGAVGFFWYCNLVGGGTCTGNNISIFGDVSGCIPAPQCPSYTIPCTMTFFRCWGAGGGCSNTCIGAASNWVMTVIGETVDEPAAPTSSAGNTICEGSSTNLTGSGIFGVPPYVFSWNNGGGVGNPVTVSPTATTTYTATVTDACGNTATNTITINVVPLPDPGLDNAISVCPSDPNISLFSQLGGTPDAGGSWSGPSPLGGGSAGNFNPGTSNAGVYTYTVTGAAPCVNQTATVTVSEDNTAPNINCPGNLTAVCAITEQPAYATLAQFTAAGGTATDAGGIDAASFTLLSQVSNGLSCPETVTRTYQIADLCGNTSTCAQIITIDDNIAPVFAAAPAAVTVDCIGNVPAMTNLAWTDNCAGAGNVPGVDGALVGGACGGTITRTWTFTDPCGNPATATQIITVDDNVAPVFAAPPAAVTVDCIGNVPAMTNLAYTDNCDPNGNVAGVDGALVGGACGGTITRTWTFTDACGNPATATQIITVDDNVAPVFAAPPAAVTVDCIGNVPAMTNLAYTDNCDPNGSVAGVDGALVGGACGGTITRTWTFTDACGNPATATQIITVDDNVAPVFAAPPAAVTVDCIGNVPAMTNLAYTDNCDPNGSVAGVDGALVGGACGGTITRTWTFTDACGNPATATQIITVDDNVAPVFAAPPAAVTVDCIGNVPAMTNLAYTDNCDPNGNVAGVDGALVGGACGGTITRTWTYTDACGNPATATQIITVDDNVAPVFAAPPAAVTVDCIGNVPAMTNLAYTDNCDPNGNVAGVDGALVGGPCGGTITRTWTYTDACGNPATATQIITVDDNVAPVFAAAPAAITVECIGDVPAMTNLAWTDNCDGAGNEPGVDGALVGGACGGTITRTWTYTDACGNVATATQTITIDDTTDPTATNPANINQAGGVAPPPDVTVVTDEADNCGVPVVAFVSDVSDNGNCPETITRTYSVTDACGNTINVIQLIIIGDALPPTGTPPGALNVECAADVPAADPTLITDEADNNGVPIVTHLSDVSDNNTCPEVITRTYRITDACGNVTDVIQLITVHDVTAPVFAAPPAAVTVDCIGNVPAMTNLAYTDNCDPNGNVAGVDGALVGGPCGGTITRTWTFTDACGNPATATQIITVDDNVAPVFAAAPAAITVQCVGDVPAMTNLAWTDNCDGAGNEPGVDGALVGGACGGTITRTWTYTDACGNVATATQIITVDDTTDPTASNPPDINIAGGVAPPADITVVTDELDNCGVPVVAFVSDVSDNASCPETITRTYSVTDACGNTINVVQLIIIGDAILPTASNPADLFFLCPQDVPLPDPLLVIDEADNGGVPVVAWVSDVSDGNTCPETIVRTYSVTDNCGNVIQVFHNIFVQDLLPPSGAAPGPANYECVADIPAGNPGMLTSATDNCTANPVVVFIGDVSDGNTCPETILRSWTITDDCGNVTQVDQQITVLDVTAPVFAAAPAAITVECIGDVPAMTNLAWTDNCDGAGNEPGVDGALVGGACGGTITRTWTYTDACGNVATATQIITVDDTTDPTASNPADINQAGGVAPAPDVTVVTDELDNCSVPVVAFVSDVSDNGNCPETITRTYSVTDACGNTINVIQLIIIGDPISPTASNPAAINVECITAVPLPDVTVVTDEADNGGVPTVAFVSDVSDGLSCPETITRTYSVTDNCGNSINVTQAIVIQDVTNPTASNAAPVAVECIGDVPAADITVITDEADNCGTPTVAFVSDVSDGLSCPETITRTYSVTDSCGNSINVTQTITVLDVTAPVFAAAPAAITVECIGDVPAMTNLAWTDNCDGAGNEPGVDGALVGGACGGTITRTWSYTDACGNVATTTQIITVDDTTDPTASNPANINQAGGVAPAPDVTVVTDEADNCGVPVVAFVSDVSDNNPCPETITRTYSVTDACGNTINVVQLIIIGDPILPTGTAPAAINVECITAVPLADPTLIVDEADNNGVPVVTHLSDVSDGNSCPEVITRTYRITDQCGNILDVTQLITVQDVTNPTASNAAPIAVECIGDVPAADITVITDEADNCGTPTVAFVGDASDGLSCPETITRTYSVTDSCGNTINVTQTITVLDVTAPVFAAAPAAITVECIGDVPAMTNLAWTDNCDGAGNELGVDGALVGGACGGTITRTWTYTDACGNVATATQIITVDDTTDPTASNPADINQGGGVAPAPDVTVVTDELDNCGVPVVAFVSDVSDNNPCPETIVRTYSVTDACGNQILVTQNIIISDPIAPTASNPAGINVECITAVPLPDPTVVIDEADNQGVPVVAFVSDVSDGLSCPETITRTYSVTDVCGNAINVTQTITVQDVTDPTASNPAPIAVQCSADVPAFDITVVTDEADNCGTPTVAFVGDASDGLSCPETITRTYSVTDSCGNSINVTQTITVNDTQNPTASNPIAINVECIADVPLSDVTVVTDEADNCTVNPVVLFVSDVSDGLTCPETITRTYSVTDDCGNSINVFQTITVQDITDPVLAVAPGSITVNCIGDVPAMTNLAYTDNCDPAGNVVGADGALVGTTCGGTITRTWTITDACGNTATASQVITIDDSIFPTASNPPDIVVACASNIPAPDPTVVIDEADNCTANPTVIFISDQSDGNTCNSEVITRTYEVSDDCGNSIQVSHTITIDATTPIVDAGLDQGGCSDILVTLNAINPNGAAISWDNGVTDGVPFAPPVNTTTTYTVTAGICPDGLGNFECTATDNVDVEVYQSPVINFVADNLFGCLDHYVLFDNQSTEMFNCEWDLGDGTILNGCDDFAYTYTTAGTFDVTLTITSINGCTSTDTYVDYIEVVPYPVAAFSYSPDDLTVLNTEVNFTNNSTNADSYSWSFGDQGTSTDVDPTHTYPNNVGNFYTVTLTANNDAGCSNETTAVIQIMDELIFYIPNTFTPDGNSINNEFKPVITAGIDWWDYHITIFNRWGELVFESYDPGVGWDGLYNGVLVEDGVFIWQLEFGETMTDKRQKHRGHVTVLK